MSLSQCPFKRRIDSPAAFSLWNEVVKAEHFEQMHITNTGVVSFGLEMEVLCTGHAFQLAAAGNS